MEKLFRAFSDRIQYPLPSYKRYLFSEIQWKERLICIKGSRGVGKTTLLLQYIKGNSLPAQQVLYVSLDDLYFTYHTLTDLAEDFVNNGGLHLFLDEVHKYPLWSREIKNIYDRFPKLKIVFTGSSILQIEHGDADLSRRAVVYLMKGLSFREYLEMELDLHFSALSLQDILKEHVEICGEISAKIKILMHFKNYLKTGYYPFYREGLENYKQKLLGTVNIIIESDLPAAVNIQYGTITKIKKLLYILSTTVPFIPNIAKLAERVETTRPHLLLLLEYLKNAELIHLLRAEAEGISFLVKPDKIYLENTNLMYALAPENVNSGNLRETFFFNQVSKIGEIATSKSADFKVKRKYVFEVGGKNKDMKQIRGITNAWIAADDITIGFGKKIPIWLFGFLY